MSEARDDGNDAPRHHAEVALFLQVHLGRVPGVLWPDFDHPVFQPSAGPPELRVLESGLGALIGMRVNAAPREGAQLDSPVITGPSHLLVHQCKGSVVWSVFPGVVREGRPALTYNLRKGEVLYVPPARACMVELSGPSRCVVSYLSPQSTEISGSSAAT